MWTILTTKAIGESVKGVCVCVCVCVGGVTVRERERERSWCLILYYFNAILINIAICVCYTCIRKNPKGVSERFLLRRTTEWDYKLYNLYIIQFIIVVFGSTTTGQTTHTTARASTWAKYPMSKSSQRWGLRLLNEELKKSPHPHPQHTHTHTHHHHHHQTNKTAARFQFQTLSYNEHFCHLPVKFVVSNLTPWKYTARAVLCVPSASSVFASKF